MLKHFIKLPNGRGLSSGCEGAVIMALELTEAVNSNTELTLGSTCASMIEVTIFDDDSLEIKAGDELRLYRGDKADEGQLIGLFTAEKPTRVSANTIRVTAYDRVSRLDKDLTQWLAGLDAWPYPLLDFAKMVCQACRLSLVNTQIPNGGYPVQKFSADGITGRQLMQWIGEIAGRFCRATADGDIELAWYTPATIALVAARKQAVDTSCVNGHLTLNVDSAEVTEGEDGVTVESEDIQVTDDGQGNVMLILRQYYFQNSLSFEDYCVAPIKKVQLRQNENDVGTVYPNTSEEVNTYTITGNYLLTASTAEDLVPVAKVLYDHLATVAYTPCKISIPANLLIRAGNTVQITDRSGRTITAYVMTRTQSGQKNTLECTGSASRDSSSVVNNQNYKALSGKVLNLRTDVDGLKAENKDTKGRVASIAMDVERIETRASRQENTAQGLQEMLTVIEQTAESVSVAVKKIQDEGVGKVETGAGYTFSDDGLIISNPGEEMENRLDNTGMYVGRSGNVILRANNKGVEATDVIVHVFLKVGDHARFEDYTDGTDSRRTACFWI